MTEINAGNERIKRAYIRYLKEADQKAEATIRAAGHHLRQFEASTDLADFATFNSAQAIAFKKGLVRDGLSEVTRHRAVNEAKRFFKWLRLQNGYRSKIDLTDIEFFNLSAHDVQVAKSAVPRDYATLEQVKAAIGAMPAETEVQQRDRAVLAFILLTQMRDQAVASLRLKHVDIERMLVHQDPREVKTKFRKPIETFLLPIDETAEDIVIDWIRYLREVRHFGANDPVFPRTASSFDATGMNVANTVEPISWKTASPIRAIFKRAFEGAGIRYFPPHTIRHTVTHLVTQRPLTPEVLRAFAQNLGHSSPMTTITSYGHVSTSRQGELLRALLLTPSKEEDDAEELLARLQALVRKRG
ncbi:MAG: tyrosine-type recombinase/integrase [Bauldia sp.]|nr:tyrosine-type recombinase/integrase [Bauldia sp.]